MLRKNAVPDQNSDNFFKSTVHELGCCDGSAIDCQYSGSYTQANSVTELTITENGAAVVLPLVIAGGATAEVAQAAILATLVAAGYYDDENQDWPAVVVTDGGTTLDIVITGDIVVSTLTASGGTTTFNADCVRANLCTYSMTGFTGGTTSYLHINGVAVSIDPVVPGTTAEGTVEAAVEAALLAEGITATATATDQTTTYDISVTPIQSNVTLYAIGASLVKFYFNASDCVQTYID